jgi:hypothetical protein
LVVLDAAERESLYRDLREQDPDLWEPACHRLGEMAGSDKLAYRTLCDLLLSQAPELRLRGLVALRILAPEKPLEVGQFLTDRVAEARVSNDPVLLDMTFFAFTALPKQAGKDFVRGYLTDPHEGIRAAAAAAVCFWSDWPDGTLARLAQDSSVNVRAGLITALSEFKDSPDRSQAISILKSAGDPLLKELLEELDQEAVAYPADPTPVALNRTEIASLLKSARPTSVQVARMEQALDEDPETCLALVRDGLDLAGCVAVLQQLGDLCRDNGLGTLLRTWSGIRRLRYLPAQEFLLSVLGILEGYSDDDFLLPLREFLKSCVQAVEGGTTLDLVAWSYDRQVSNAAKALGDTAELDGLALAPEGPTWLDILARTGAEFEGTSLFQLSHLNTELARIGDEIGKGCPRPERELLLSVVSEWQRILSHDIEQMMGGEAS